MFLLVLVRSNSRGSYDSSERSLSVRCQAGFKVCFFGEWFLPWPHCLHGRTIRSLTCY